MRRVDVGWVSFGVAITLSLVLVSFLSPINDILVRFPNVFAFIKFAFLAIQGDFLVHRIKRGSWRVVGWPYKMMMWGVLGILIRFAFIFYETLGNTLGDTLLGTDALLGRAVMMSFLMNATFAPLMMSTHHLSDIFIEKMLEGDLSSIQNTTWRPFYRFIFLRTLPFFWFPAHVLSFLMPASWRLLYAAALGVMLGVLQAVSKSR